MTNWWNESGWQYAWAFCTFVLPVIIFGFVYSQL